MAKVTAGTADRGAGRGRLYDSVADMIGNTPCVKISPAMCPPGRTIYAKCEYVNPGSSMKDRCACGIIEDAERKGLLKPGGTVVEASTGNNGIALAMLCARKGYQCVICMAAPYSIERRKIMRFMGAKVIVTPGKGTGAVAKAKQLAEKHGWFLCGQYGNNANSDFHYNTTGAEILNDFNGQRLDYFVLGYGSGGTFAGAGRAIKEKRPDVKLVVAEPEAAPILHSGVKTDRNPDGSAKGSHPDFKAHPIQGVTPDFLAKIMEDGIAEIGYDELVRIPGEAAIETAGRLAKTQGIFAGISSGASMWAAIEMAKRAPEGSVLLVMLGDTGERYLTTELFHNIQADMNAEELDISESAGSSSRVSL